ncbi:hypothetical protein SAMN05880582_10952 [Rhizobium sp. RU20A]|nr:hypothetical protein [Rhizobium sp. RU20A]SIR27525.1 hypothetical protein SAMN05880582_10952 [Rhizobium sp. RU20A]
MSTQRESANSREGSFISRIVDAFLMVQTRNTGSDLTRQPR